MRTNIHLAVSGMIVPVVVRKKEFKSASEEDLPEACSDLSAAYLSFKQASTAEETEAARRAVTAASLALSTVPNRWWDRRNPAPAKVDGRHRHAPRIIHRLDKLRKLQLRKLQLRNLQQAQHQQPQ